MILGQSHETSIYWEMANFICEQILKRIQSVVPKDEFVSLNSNEVVNIDKVYQFMYM
jgi:DNA-binding LytR/AlgR family response regulator